MTRVHGRETVETRGDFALGTSETWITRRPCRIADRVTVAPGRGGGRDRRDERRPARAPTGQTPSGESIPAIAAHDRCCHALIEVQTRIYAFSLYSCDYLQFNSLIRTGRRIFRNELQHLFALDSRVEPVGVGGSRRPCRRGFGTLIFPFGNGMMRAGVAQLAERFLRKE